MDDFASLGLMLVLAFAFPVFPLLVAPILQPRQPTEAKRIPYECGVDTIGKLGLFALCEMLVFVGILAIGLWYAWKKGALSWK